MQVSQHKICQISQSGRVFDRNMLKQKDLEPGILKVRYG